MEKRWITRRKCDGSVLSEIDGVVALTHSNNLQADISLKRPDPAVGYRDIHNRARDNRKSDHLYIIIGLGRVAPTYFAVATGRCFPESKRSKELASCADAHIVQSDVRLIELLMFYKLLPCIAIG